MLPCESFAALQLKPRAPIHPIYKELGVRSCFLLFFVTRQKARPDPLASAALTAGIGFFAGRDTGLAGAVGDVKMKGPEKASAAPRVK